MKENLKLLNLELKMVALVLFAILLTLIAQTSAITWV